MYKPISETHSDEILSDNTGMNYCAQCYDCVYNNGGDNFSNSYNKSCCAKFPYPDCKPITVINNQERCEYYTMEK